MHKTLNQLSVGESGFVENLSAEGSIRRRFRDLGIINGTKIKCTGQSTHCDIGAYLIKGAVIAIRSGDAKTVLLK